MPANVAALSRMGQPFQQEGFELRRPLSLNRRGVSPAPDSERVAVSLGRSLIGGAVSSAACPHALSREPRPHRAVVAEPAASSSMSQKRGRGPPLPQSCSRTGGATGQGGAATATRGKEASLYPANSNVHASRGIHPDSVNDSLMDLLQKPLLPQNGLLHERLADQLLEPRRVLGKASKAGGAKVLPDYDDEAHKLWARLNLDPNKDTNGTFKSLDPVWRHPQSGGTLYVGNEVAAKTLSLLQGHGISHVVNCTDSIPNYHEKQPGAPITYFRFDVTSHYHRARTDKDAVAFAQPMIDFVSDALSRGKNVMVHCLAGAHRAGTTGIICLMHFAKLSAKDATFIAKRCRPIIDPICDFPLLLARIEKGWFERAHGG